MTTIHQAYLNNRERPAFSLIELIIAITLLGLVLAGAYSLSIGSLRSIYLSEGQLQVSRDIRVFTHEMAKEARSANAFVIFDSFTARDEQSDGSSGDFLLLLYRNTDTEIYKSVGYYRDAPASADSEGPVLKFETTYDPPLAAGTAVTLPDSSTAGDHQKVIELSKGLADGKLFYNYFGRSVMIKGEIIRDGNTQKRATSTYNFTVQPRG